MPYAELPDVPDAWGIPDDLWEAIRELRIRPVNSV